MRRRSLPWILLLCGFPALGHAATPLGEQRLEAVPAESWMRGPTARLRLAAGTPVAFTSSSQAWVEGSWRLRPGCLLWTLAGQMNAGAFSENELGLGLRVGDEWLAIQTRVHRRRRAVARIASESTMHGDVALVAGRGRARFGLRQEFPLRSGRVELPSTVSYAFWVCGEFWSAALLRQDSPYEPRGIWSAGVQLTLAPLSLALKGDPGGASLQVGLNRAPFEFRLALPVASSIDAGPYLGLELGGKEAGEPR